MIKKYIDRLVNKGITQFAIYPYGKIGREIEQIINKDYVDLNYVVFDKNYDNQKILSPQLISGFKEYCFFVSTVKKEIKNQVVAHLLNQGVEDKKIIKIFEYDELFIDDRKNRIINHELIEKVKFLRTVEQKMNTCIKEIVNKEKIIVSLTSFPARIAYIEPTLQSLFQQSFRPDKVILWLAEDEFPNRTDSLPKFFTRIKCDFFEIRWCKNWKSYKKLIPSLSYYPDAIIVTADDDLIYGKDWLKKLYDTHIEYPEDIICHRVTKILKDKNGRWAALPGGFDYYSGASYLNKQCGVGGVLYPINCLFDDVKEDRLFSALAPTSDDIWFWLMGAMVGTKVRASNSPETILSLNNNLKETPALTTINDQGEKLFWVHFYQILSVYPELVKKLEEEYDARKGVLE